MTNQRAAEILGNFAWLPSTGTPAQDIEEALIKAKIALRNAQDEEECEACKIDWD